MLASAKSLMLLSARDQADGLSTVSIGLQCVVVTVNSPGIFLFRSTTYTPCVISWLREQEPGCHYVVIYDFCYDTA